MLDCLPTSLKYLDYDHNQIKTMNNLQFGLKSLNCSTFDGIKIESSRV